MMRCKPSSYFEAIQKENGNIMETYMKDDNGDPLCPINGKIKGLFFTASHEYNTYSPFGEQCLEIPAKQLYETCRNLYFADFYCIPKSKKQIHYVTIVMTKPGSVADTFCDRYLLRLEPDANSFLAFDAVTCRVPADRPSVEVFFTEDIDIEKESLSSIRSKGTSSPNGFPKSFNCSICNSGISRESPLFTCQVETPKEPITRSQMAEKRKREAAEDDTESISESKKIRLDTTDPDKRNLEIAVVSPVAVKQEEENAIEPNNEQNSPELQTQRPEITATGAVAVDNHIVEVDDDTEAADKVKPDVKVIKYGTRDPGAEGQDQVETAQEIHQEHNSGHSGSMLETLNSEKKGDQTFKITECQAQWKQWGTAEDDAEAFAAIISEIKGAGLDMTVEKTNVETGVSSSRAAEQEENQVIELGDIGVKVHTEKTGNGVMDIEEIGLASGTGLGREEGGEETKVAEGNSAEREKIRPDTFNDPTAENSMSDNGADKPEEKTAYCAFKHCSSVSDGDQEQERVQLHAAPGMDTCPRTSMAAEVRSQKSHFDEARDDAVKQSSVMGIASSAGEEETVDGEGNNTNPDGAVELETNQ